MPVIRPERKTSGTFPYRFSAALNRRADWLEKRLTERGDSRGGASFERTELDAILECMARLDIPRKNRGASPARDLEEPPVRPDSMNEIEETWVPGNRKGQTDGSEN